MLGTRTAAGQVWIEKPGFELRRVVRQRRRATAFDQWQEFGKIRFPAKIEISDDKGVVATLTVQSVNRDRALGRRPPAVLGAGRAGRQGALSRTRDQATRQEVLVRTRRRS